MINIRSRNEEITVDENAIAVDGAPKGVIVNAASQFVCLIFILAVPMMQPVIAETTVVQIDKFSATGGALHFGVKVVNSSNIRHNDPSGFPDIFLNPA